MKRRLYHLAQPSKHDCIGNGSTYFVLISRNQLENLAGELSAMTFGLK